jgi:hypothetical protein
MSQNDEYPTMNHNLEGLIPKRHIPENMSSGSGRTLIGDHQVEGDVEFQFNKVPDMKEFANRLGRANLINKFLPTD